MPLADGDLDPPVHAAKVVGQGAHVPARAAGDRPGKQGGLPNTALEDGGIAVDGERQGGAVIQRHTADPVTDRDRKNPRRATVDLT